MNNDKKILIQSIQEFSLKYPQKIEFVEKSLNLLEKYNDNEAFLRTCCNDGHFTSGVLVLNLDKTKVLLMHHKKLGTWQHFGGHADGEIDLRNSAIRELEEESGISQKDATIGKDIFNIDVHFVPANNGEKEHYHYDINFLSLVDDTIKMSLQEDEVNDIKWFPIEEVLRDIDSQKFSSGCIKNINMIAGKS